MTALVIWFLILAMGALLMTPVVTRVFNQLPTRGYGLSKLLFLLGLGYLHWLSVTIGVSSNSRAGIALVLVFLVIVNGMVDLANRQNSARRYFSRNWRYVLRSELIFLAGFGLMVLMRAHAPDIAGTEQPMELAFINAIFTSPTFPPQDPWLAGYAISYYYFGYLISATLCLLTGIPTAIGFNLTLAMTFGLVCQSAYELVYNMLLLRDSAQDGTIASNKRMRYGVLALLAPFFILIVSNGVGFMDSLHAKGFFWQNKGGQLTSPFWQWLDIQELKEPPPTPFGWEPKRPGITWWRASRVLSDYTQAGTYIEVIDEFPFFSYYLGDLHPHVLGMPYIIGILGLTLNGYLFLSRRKQGPPGFLKTILRVFNGSWLPSTGPEQWLAFQPWFWLLAIGLGSLGFMNIWDFPIYLVVASLVLTSVNLQRCRFSLNILRPFIEWMVMLGLIGFSTFYFFFLGFDSQAGGFLPSLGFFTRGTHLWVMFMPLFVPLLTFLLYKGFVFPNRQHAKAALLAASVMVFGLWLLSYLYAGAIGFAGWMGAQSSTLGEGVKMLLGRHEAASMSTLISHSLLQRLQSPGGWVTILVFVGLVVYLILNLSGEMRAGESDRPPRQVLMIDLFAAILAFAAIGLLLVPEFIYLRDMFGSRMNTIFKFYYQVWLLLSILAAYFISLFLTSAGKPLYKLLVLLLIFISTTMGLFYPVFNLASRLQSNTLSLDGELSFGRYNTADHAAIQWLKTKPKATVSEAVGNSYSGFAAVSTHSGFPAVLGWPGHEGQWRGGYKEVGSRQSDIQMLYEVTAWEDALKAITMYNIKYIYVGMNEQKMYKIDENKFIQNLALVYDAYGVRIYEVPDGYLK